MQTERFYPYLLNAIAKNNVLPFTSRCNLGCIFCSHRQNPPGVETFRLPHLPADAVLELAQFLDPRRKVVIGESATRLDEGEPFTHPEAAIILRGVRQRLPETLIALTTNGTLLTQQLADELADLGPLELTVSLNSVTEHGRLLLLNDREPHRALDAIARLASLGIPFHGSLVAMPHLTGMEDITETVSFLAENGALTVRVFLPGYTKFAAKDLRFPLSLWDELVALARELTLSIGVPVIPEPSVLHSLTPEIYGVIRGTPAECAGVLTGDTILAVDGNKARTRVEAFTLAQKAADPKLQLMRDGKLLEVSLDKSQGRPPGFVVQYDLDTARIEQIGDEITCRASVSPLVLASQLGLSVVRAAVEQIGFAPNHVHPVVNRFFGGSIQSAGLLTVEDFLATATELTFTPDMVLVPREAFDHKGCDLTGKNIQVLDEALGFPVVAV
ncbi:MAG: DUF512 domain-containing protein [Clostridiales bacterium]|jgi:NifB/MoaA-like Fe-S oxidoreductase|nr:DUF512 domain-containing protein [Clostridiales bacterium]